MNLKNTTLSLKINVVYTFWDGTFGPERHKKWTFLIIYYLWGPAQKLQPQNR